jgi:hypothetical protein
LDYLTWTNSLVPLGYDGFGRNGLLLIRPGWGRRCLVTTPTDDYLLDAHESCWGMGRKRPSGFLAGYKVTTQGLGAPTLQQIPKEETQGCGGPAERQLDPGPKPPCGLHDGSLLRIHHTVDPHRGDKPPSGTGRFYCMGQDTLGRLHYRIGLQSTIRRPRTRLFTFLRLESLDPAEMQILCVANYPEPYLDG